MKNLKVGILNCSDIAKRRIIPAFQEIEGVEITSVCSRSLEKAKAYSELFGIPVYTDNEEDLFDCDIVYISSPPSEHFKSMYKFVSRGINVLCEKSFTLGQDYTVQIIEEAESNGAIVQENYGFEYHDQWKWIIEKLPELGEIISINSGFEFPPRDKSKDFRYKRELGGGALFDAGGYPIKAASLIMSNLNLGEISGSNRLDFELGVDVSGNVYFLDNDGISAFLTWSFESPYRCEIEITGTKGKLRSRKIFSPKPDEVVTVERTDMFGKIVETKEFKCDQFIELIRDFIDRINNKDRSHHKRIIKQSKWQDYAKTISFRTVTNGI